MKLRWNLLLLATAWPATDAPGRQSDATRAVSWKVEPEGLLSISPAGRATPLRDGTATLTASKDGAQATTTIIVKGAAANRPLHFTNDVVPVMTKYGCKELKSISAKVLKTYGLALKALKTEDKKFVDQVIKGEEEIDDLEKTYKNNHIERLKKKICNPELDTIFVECLRNLERISDHSYNIALSLIY
jgi:hypothetical protein